MYTHYFVSSFGIDNPYKKYITSMQIYQFYTCIIHFCIVYAYEKLYPIEYAYMQPLYHMTMITLFTAFYKKSYSEKQPKQDTE